jgi:hypothetical protein
MPEQTNIQNLEDWQFEEITRLAALLISPRDIAIFLDLDEKEFLYEISLKKSEISRAFRKGYLKTLINSREKLFQEVTAYNNDNGDNEDNEGIEIPVTEDKMNEITRLLEEYEAIIQTDINNA